MKVGLRFRGNEALTRRYFFVEPAAQFPRLLAFFCASGFGVRGSEGTAAGAMLGTLRALSPSRESVRR